MVGTNAVRRKRSANEAAWNAVALRPEFSGRLEYVERGEGEKPQAPCWCITGPAQVTRAAEDIMKDYQWHHGETLAFPDSGANAENIRWLMGKYPLTPADKLTELTWTERFRKLEFKRERRGQLMRLEEVESTDARFRGELWGYQKKGLDFLKKTSGVALIADDRRLGKTVQTLAYLVNDRNTFPCLIVAGLSQVENWNREIGRFIEKDRGVPFTVKIINCGKPGDLKEVSDAGTVKRPEIYVINYDLLAKRKEDLRRVGLKTIVADEIHNVRGETSQRNKALKELGQSPSVAHRIGLSGTPFYKGNLDELWNILAFVSPEFLKDIEHTKEYYKNNGNDERRYLFDELSRSVMLRRTKEEVWKDMPAKVVRQQRIRIDRNYYDREMSLRLETLRKRLENAKNGAADEDATDLDECGDEECASRDERAATRAFTAFANGERLVTGLAKVDFAAEFVRCLMAEGEAIVVYCHHRKVHGLLCEKLGEYKPAVIIGGQSDEQRQKAIDGLSKGATKLMIASIRAGGEGIDLSAANQMVMVEFDWSPARHWQAEDRLIHHDKREPTFIHYLEGEGTYDERISNIIAGKSRDIRGLLRDPREAIGIADRARDIETMVERQLAAASDNKALGK
ncbi:Uncharacterised protein [uncultured archaeon]|nr:Uncharacterised protein [uncultured archaeon]